MAILHQPRLLIADEATSALDAITQAEILELFRRLNRELGMAMLFISHDLLAVGSFARASRFCGRDISSNPAPTRRCSAHPAPKTRGRCSQAVLRNTVRSYGNNWPG